MSRTPLTSRPLDLVYFLFFMCHIPASLLMDFQVFYPKSWVPEFIQSLPKLYVQSSGDPLIGGVLGIFETEPFQLLWFKSFLLVELVFQFPVFFVGAYGLWKGSQAVYVLLLVYATSTATTTLPCLATIIYAPSTTVHTVLHNIASLTLQQRLLLLSSYVPFFLIPLLMATDMAVRVTNLVQPAMRIDDVRKRR